jgi:RNase P/RNase MRP subunit p30
MRRFLDLHLRPRDQGELEAMLMMASELGFGGVAVAYEDLLEDLEPPEGLEVISRIDLNPKTAGALKAALRRVRRLYEVVAVECRSKAVARQAARDHRVDVVYLPPDSGLWFDEAEARLSAQTGCAYEINLSEFLALLGEGDARALRRVAEGVENAYRKDVDIVLSSGASTRLEMRDPRGLASTLTLLDVEYEEALEMVSENPWSIVQRNRRRLSGEYVTSGVRIIREP